MIIPQSFIGSTAMIIIDQRRPDNRVRVPICGPEKLPPVQDISLINSS